ncbi:hypothetical protein BGZ96_000910 [Linnemannia gamsii]|uniref:Pal1-domain-containing protein n=1 Tax=Linnemannia gamsii TaxID=64522 RepID=A0ABQ7JNT1_9FUNG|nr:hypothetical protein BGZ96_000910 [Linnemannia gamsii]
MKIYFISLFLFLGATLALGSSGSLITDNSRGNQLFRLDQNGNPSIYKEGVLYDLQRRSLVNNLLESDEASIQNVNNNSNHGQTMRNHGNTHATTTTTITRIHKEPSSEAEQWIRQSGLFNHRTTTGPFTATPDVVLNSQDADEHGQLVDRRGVLRGESATTISNVNDKREKKEVMETLDPSESRIQNRRALYKFGSTHMSHPQPQDQGDGIGANLIDKRAMTTTLTTTTTTAIVEFEDDDKDKKKKMVDDITRRNLVTIQIITQNTNTNNNGHSIDNSSNNNNVYPIKVINQGNDDKKKKKKDSPHHRPSSPTSKKNIQPKNHNNKNKQNDHSRKSIYATKPRNKTKKANNKPSPRRLNNAQHAN